jgi:hypothetical protein
MKYSKSDVQKAKEIFLRLRTEAKATGESSGPELAMFSFGYGGVWPDGDVTAGCCGFIFALDDDGDLVETYAADDGSGSEE